MDKEICLAKAKLLRDDPSVHYNCSQATLLALLPEGADEDTCLALTTLFGGGMKNGLVCGAVTGALMALGFYGGEPAQAQELVRRFRARNGELNCTQLLKEAVANGEERKSHCDRMVFDAVEIAVELLNEKQ